MSPADLDRQRAIARRTSEYSQRLLKRAVRQIEDLAGDARRMADEIGSLVAQIEEAARYLIDHPADPADPATPASNLADPVSGMGS